MPSGARAPQTFLPNEPPAHPTHVLGRRDPSLAPVHARHALPCASFLACAQTTPRSSARSPSRPPTQHPYQAEEEAKPLHLQARQRQDEDVPPLPQGFLRLRRAVLLLTRADGAQGAQVRPSRAPVAAHSRKGEQNGRSVRALARGLSAAALVRRARSAHARAERATRAERAWAVLYESSLLYFKDFFFKDPTSEAPRAPIG